VHAVDLSEEEARFDEERFLDDAERAQLLTKTSEGHCVPFLTPNATVTQQIVSAVEAATCSSVNLADAEVTMVYMPPVQGDGAKASKRKVIVLVPRDLHWTHPNKVATASVGTGGCSV
jgi:hypothetical protein